MPLLSRAREITIIAIFYSFVGLEHNSISIWKETAAWLNFIPFQGGLL